MKTDTGASVAVVVAPAVPLAVREARRRWADLLRLIYEVDPLVCVRCGGAMRVAAIVTARDTIAEILAHVRARSPPVSYTHLDVYKRQS